MIGQRWEPGESKPKGWELQGQVMGDAGGRASRGP